MTGVASDMGQTPPARHCVSCGRAMDWQGNVCAYCGHDYRYYAIPAGKPKTAKPVIGGALIIVAGVLAVAMGLMFVVVDASDLEEWGVDPIPESGLSISELEEILGTCGVIVTVLGLIAILGGAFAALRKGFPLAIVGGLFAMAGIGFLLGAVLGLIGLILVAVSRNEF